MNGHIKYLILVVVFWSFLTCESGNNLENEHLVGLNADTTILSDQVAHQLTTFSPNKNEGLQSFIVNTNERQLIKGELGTLITFPAGCFAEVNESVTIELRECYSVQQLLFNQLSTRSIHGEMLESDGMIYIRAINKDGDDIDLVKEIEVQMPTKQIKTGIHVFEGVESEHGVIWSLNSRQLITKDPPKVGVEIKENHDHDKVMDESIPEDSTGVSITTISPAGLINERIKDENILGYVFQISKLGWINCDKYIEGSNQDITVSVDSLDIGASYHLVLSNYNSVLLQETEMVKNIIFKNVPLNEPFTLVGFGMKGDQIYFGMQDYEGGRVEVQFEKLKPISRDEMLSRLLERFGSNIWSRPQI